MADSDGFTLVKYRYPKQNKFKKKRFGTPKSLSNFSTAQISCSNKQLDLVINNIKTCQTELQDTPFYNELLLSMSKVLSVNVVHSDQITVDFQDFVCYGIGKLSECPTSRYQFALLVLLWEHFKPSGKCFIYDPVFGNIDEEIVKHFGLDIIPRNEEAKRRVSQKTLFFVPHGGKPLYNNILWANWGPNLKNVVIFGNSFASYQERMPLHQLESEASFIAQIIPLTNEIRLRSWCDRDDIFNDMSLHYFLDDQLCKQPSSFWNNCKEPIYEENNMEIVSSTSLSPENDKEIENKGADIQLTIG
jgi:hypothetical protein